MTTNTQLAESLYVLECKKTNWIAAYFWAQSEEEALNKMAFTLGNYKTLEEWCQKDPEGAGVVDDWHAQEMDVLQLAAGYFACTDSYRWERGHLYADEYVYYERRSGDYRYVLTDDAGIVVEEGLIYREHAGRGRPVELLDAVLRQDCVRDK